MNDNIIHEAKNFIISALAVILTIASFELLLLSGFTYQLAKTVDKIRIYLRLVPTHILPKMEGGYSQSILPVNIMVFILVNILLGLLAFKLVRKRGSNYSGLIHGLFMSLVFLIIALILVDLSNDPFNYLAVFFGFPIVLFVQSCVASCLLFREGKKTNTGQLT